MVGEPFRVRVLDALAAEIATIRDADGYWNNLFPVNVTWGRAIFGDRDPHPMISILEVPVPLDQKRTPPDGPYSSGPWELLVQGFAEDDKFFPTRTAHRLMSDVKRKLAIARRKTADYDLLGMRGQVTGLTIGAGVVRPPDEVSASAYFWLNLTLDLVEDLTDPYN